MHKTILLGGYRTIVATRHQLAQIMVADCLAARQAPDRILPKLVFSSNGQGIALGGSDPDFFRTMQQSDIIHADGMPVVQASRLTDSPLPERIATTDFFHDAARAASDAALSFFLLGGTERQNAEACARIAELYPRLRLAGRRDGYFERSDDAAVCEEIRSSGADVLWVALGKPLQERWSVANRASLMGVGWIKTCGGLYSFLSGEASRAPAWMRDSGLEWLHRTLKEPRRLLWRYLTTNVHATYRLLTKSARHGEAAR